MIAFLLIFAATLAGGFVFPWWWPAWVGVLSGLWRPQARWRTFGVAFLGTGLAWGLAAAFYQIGNHGLLAGKVAPIFHLPGGGYLILVTALIGGLTAGLSALLGRSLALLREP